MDPLEQKIWDELDHIEFLTEDETRDVVPIMADIKSAVLRIKTEIEESFK